MNNLVNRIKAEALRSAADQLAAEDGPNQASEWLRQHAGLLESEPDPHTAALVREAVTTVLDDQAADDLMSSGWARALILELDRLGVDVQRRVSEHGQAPR